MTLFEVDEAANRIRQEVDEEANIIFGSTFEEALEGSIRVSVVATGIEAAPNAEQRPMPIGLTTVMPNSYGGSTPVDLSSEPKPVEELVTGLEVGLPTEERKA